MPRPSASMRRPTLPMSRAVPNPLALALLVPMQLALTLQSVSGATCAVTAPIAAAITRGTSRRTQTASLTTVWTVDGGSSSKPIWRNTAARLAPLLLNAQRTQVVLPPTLRLLKQPTWWLYRMTAWETVMWILGTLNALPGPFPSQIRTSPYVRVCWKHCKESRFLFLWNALPTEVSPFHP